MAKNKSKKFLSEEDKQDAPIADMLGSPQGESIDFESWWAIRKVKIPNQHRKEIIMADFKARGLKGDAMMEEFDKALMAYGVRF